MVVDTDVLIWLFRGQKKAARELDALPTKAVSVVTYLELLQGARDKAELKQIKSLLFQAGFAVLPLNENIGHRAMIYMEEYGLKVALGMADALIAATAVESNLSLLTGNSKHYQMIAELDVRRFRP